jgi:hypothetical protein
MPETKKSQETFCEAFPIFNFTLWLTKNITIWDGEKVGLFCPIPPGLGLKRKSCDRNIVWKICANTSNNV